MSQAGPNSNKDAPSVASGSRHHDAVKDSAAPTLSIHKWSEPYRSGLILASAIFIGEALIMFLLPLLPPIAAWARL